MPRYVSILGWDPAYRSLAYAYIEVNVDFALDIRAAAARCIDAVIAAPDESAAEHARRYICECCDIVNSAIRLCDCAVVDVLGKRVADTDSVGRMRALRNFLDTSRVSHVPADAIVCIEQQPAMMGRRGGGLTHGASVTVGMQLGFHYCMHDMRYVSPKRKNTFAIGGIRISDFGVGYAARKKHSSAMVRYIVELFGFDTHTIRAAYYDDFADAMMAAISACAALTTASVAVAALPTATAVGSAAVVGSAAANTVMDACNL